MSIVRFSESSLNQITPSHLCHASALVLTLAKTHLAGGCPEHHRSRNLCNLVSRPTGMHIKRVLKSGHVTYVSYVCDKPGFCVDREPALRAARLAAQIRGPVDYTFLTPKGKEESVVLVDSDPVDLPKRLGLRRLDFVCLEPKSGDIYAFGPENGSGLPVMNGVDPMSGYRWTGPVFAVGYDPGAVRSATVKDDKIVVITYNEGRYTVFARSNSGELIGKRRVPESNLVLVTATGMFILRGTDHVVRGWANIKGHETRDIITLGRGEDLLCIARNPSGDEFLVIVSNNGQTYRFVEI